MSRTRLLLVTGLAVLLLVLSVASVSAAQEDNDCKGKGKKACEAPEVPMAAALPAAAALAGVGYYVVIRRRAAQAEVPVE